MIPEYLADCADWDTSEPDETWCRNCGKSFRVNMTGQLRCAVCTEKLTPARMSLTRSQRNGSREAQKRKTDKQTNRKR